MRKLMLALSVALMLAACSGNGGTASVIALDFPSYDALRAVAGEAVMLVPPGTDIHSYEPSPRDMTQIAEADLVVFTGGHSDEWVYRVIQSLDSPPELFALTDQVELLNEEGHEHTEDEHVWTSIPNEIAIISCLAEKLSAINPAESAEYRENAAGYIRELEAIDSEIREIVSASRLNTLIFGSRFPLLYFVTEYGLDYYAAFPGCAEETEPSASTVAFLVDKAREIGTKHIMNIELSSSEIADTIAKEAGCSVLVFYSMHDVSEEDFRNGETYITFMKRNLSTLREALS